MNWSKSPLAFQDCLDIFDRALREPNGIRVRYESRAEAFQMRSRLNYCRKTDRAANAKTYPDPDHPMHGHSPYDVLTIQIPKGEANLYVRRRTVADYTIEAL
jgi:hypothetical protein